MMDAASDPQRRLVYLDSSHLIKLHRASAEARDRFFDAWNAEGYALAITDLHLQEVLGPCDDDSYTERLEMLARFQSLAGDLHPDPDEALVDDELADILIGIVTNRHIMMSSAEIRESHRAHVRARRFARLEYSSLLDVAPLSRRRYGTRARIVNIATGMQKHLEPAWKQEQKRSRKKRVAERQATPWEVQAEKLRRQVDEQFPKLPFAARQHLLTLALRGERAARRDIPSRQADLEALQLDRYRCLADTPEQDVNFIAAASHVLWSVVIPRMRTRLPGALEAYLEQRYGLLFMAHAGLAPNIIYDQATHEMVYSQFDFYRMPGYTLRMAVERARQLVGQTPAMNTWLDSSHVTFAPYVDALFVDETTFNFLQGELDARPSTIVEGAESSIRWAPSPEAALEALQQTD